jgi:hypothetical protein
MRLAIEIPNSNNCNQLKKKPLKQFLFERARAGKCCGRGVASSITDKYTLPPLSNAIKLRNN